MLNRQLSARNSHRSKERSRRVAEKVGDFSARRLLRVLRGVNSPVNQKYKSEERERADRREGAEAVCSRTEQ